MTEMTEFQRSQLRTQQFGLLVNAYATYKLRMVEAGIRDTRTELQTANRHLSATNRNLENTNQHLEKANQNLNQLNSTASVLVDVSSQQLEVQAQISADTSKLLSLEAEQLKVQKSSESEQKKQTKIAQLQLEETIARNQREEARYQEEKLESRRLRSVKDAIHQLNQQVVLIREGDYTALERLFLINRLKTAVEFISAEDFYEISDKQYRVETENMIKRDALHYESELSQQDREDLIKLEELESVDENEIAAKLLEGCKIKPSKDPILEQVKRSLGRKQQLEDSVADELMTKLDSLSR